MNRRAWLLLLLVLLAVFAWWLSREKGLSTLDRSLTDFAIVDTARVDRIFIADRSGRVADLRREGNQWTINDRYKAKRSNAELLLRTFARIEVQSPIPKSMQANALRFMSSGSMKVEIYTGGKEPEKIWYVGHATPDLKGTYMLLEVPGKGKSAEPLIMGMAGFTGHLTPRFFTSEEDWRATDLFVYPDLSAIARVDVQHPKEPNTSYSIHYAGQNDLVLRDGNSQVMPMDTLIVKDVMLKFKGIYYEALDRLLSPYQRDSLRALVPDHVVRVVDTKGEEVRATFYRKAPVTTAFEVRLGVQVDPNRMYCVINDTTLALVQNQQVEPVLLPLEVLLAKAGKR
jgi:hypothetical protein